MSFTPYLHFQGNCAEAVAFYAGVFGATLAIQRFGDMPDAPPEMAGSPLIMHALLTTPTGELMASDNPPGHEGEPQAAVTISHTAPDIASAKALFEKLMQGGAEIMPFEATFWSPGFGMGKDRFGTHWMISAPDTI